MSAEDDARRAELEALKAVVYGPHPPTAAIARLAELRTAPDDDASPAEERSGVSGEPRRRPRWIPVVAGLATLVAVVGTVAVAGRPAPSPSPSPSATAAGDREQAVALAEEEAVYEHVLDTPEHLTARDWFAAYPAGLPRPWSTAGRVHAYPGRIGGGELAVPVAPATSALLVFLVCSAPDTPFRWRLTGHLGAASRSSVLGGSSGDQCRGLNGRVVPVPPGSRDLRMRTTLAPGIHYSVTVYER